MPEAGEGRAEHGDIEAEVAEGSEQAPVRPDQFQLSLLDPVDDRGEGPASSVAMPARPWYRQREPGSADSQRPREHGQKQAVRSGAEAEGEQ